MQKRKKIFTYLYYIFLLLPFFKPAYISERINSLNTIFNALQILNFLIILVTTLKEKKVSKINIAIFLFLFINTLSTFLNNGNMYDVSVTSMRILAVSLLIDNELRKNAQDFLFSFEIMLYVLICINLVTIFLYPKGMYVSLSGAYSNWFLGFKNVHILYILPALLLSIINSHLKTGKLSVRTWLLLIVSFISLIKVWSATSLVAIVLITCFIFTTKIFSEIKFSFKSAIITYIVLFFSIVIFRLQNLFKFLIVDILKKDLTFTGRTYIWDTIIDYIKAKPFLGYGTEYRKVRYAHGFKVQFSHAHNIILETLYQTGFCGLIIIALIIRLTIKEMNKYKNNIITKNISFFLFIYLIMMLAEAYDFERFFFLFSLAYNIKYIIEIPNLKNGGIINE